jgi:transcriptional regulator GlxA family with amidase domain
LPEWLLDVLAHVTRSPRSDLSNLTLADRAGLSLEKFIRGFRQQMGETPAAYVMASRVRAAEQLLALTDQSIDQVALHCGFPNRHYLSRIFSRARGCGPAEFRKRQSERKGV